MSDQAVIAALDRAPLDGDDLVLAVEVTQEHIDSGTPGNCNACPVALAILAACGGAGIHLDPCDSVRVYGDYATVGLLDGRLYAGNLPVDARRFIGHFDHGGPGSYRPFAFPLRMGEGAPPDEEPE